MSDAEKAQEMANIGLALSAVGTVIAQTIVERDPTGETLAALRRNGKGMHNHLMDVEAPDAALMFAAFLLALPKMPD